ncbi:MAG: hypothetical protein RL338_753 [Chloroflexota bacterium]
MRVPLPSRSSDLPPLPDGFGTALDAGLEALGIELSPASRTGIEAHVRLLLAWTAAINLTAVRDPERVATAHVIDSLAALPLLRELGAADLLDIGSGGGFPGLPLALALPARRALLVESIGKKARFLETAVADLVALGSLRGGAVSVATARAEALGGDPAHRGRWPIVVARAVASLEELVGLAAPLLAPGGRLVAWKRGDLGDEIAAAERRLRSLDGGRIRLVDPPGAAAAGIPGHRLVVVTTR